MNTVVRILSVAIGVALLKNHALYASSHTWDSIGWDPNYRKDHLRP